MQVVWVNLREEPVLYINEKPYVLRDASAPLRNLTTYAGISPDRLEEVEDRLKQDVIGELRASKQVLLHDEGRRGAVPFWEHVSEADVMTPREVFERLSERFGEGEGNSVAYARVPLTPDRPPAPREFDALARCVEGGPGGTRAY